MIYKSMPSRIAISSAANFFTVFTPVFFCTFAAIMITDFKNAQQQALYVLSVAAAFTLPMLLTSLFSQFLNTRYSVRNVMWFSSLSSLLTSILGLGTVYAVTHYRVIWPLWVIAVLLGASYSIYRPAMKLYSSKSYPKAYLSIGGAILESGTFLGIFLGTISAALLQNIGYGYTTSFLAAVLSAFLGWHFCSKMDVIPPHVRHLKFSDLPRQWLDSLKKQPRYRELVITGIAESYIFGSIILMSALAVHVQGKYYPEAEFGTVAMYAILASVVLGAFFGCLAGGKFSHKNVELGLVPTSIVGMVITALLMATYPLYGNQMVGNWILAVLLFLYGFFAGIALVPVQSYPKYFVKKELAPAYFSWFYLPFSIAILVSIALVWVMYQKAVSIDTVTFGLAILSAVLGIAVCYLMPQVLLRMCMQILVSTFYRMRLFNVDRIPEEGPALLVANRASYVDVLFISCCTTRPVYFGTGEYVFKHAWLRPFLKAVGFLEVPSRKPKRLKQFIEDTQSLLRRGELVCVFPEEDITRNGTMSSFRDGITALLPDDVEVPILPVRIGMTWGSIFSCFYNQEFKFFIPSGIPHPASVAIGKPIPKTTSAYEIRIILSEIAAETELNPGPDARPFHTMFARQTRMHPFMRNIMQYDGTNWQRPTSFKVLLSSALISRYVRRLCGDHDEDEYVGVMLPNSVAAFSVMTGILMADRKVAVINFTAGKEANEHAIKTAGIRFILTSKLFLKKLKMEPLPQMICLEDVKSEIARPWNMLYWGLGAALLPADEFMKLLSPVSWNDINRVAMLIFSSGSTGLPKGIMLSHHNILADISSMTNLIGWTKRDSMLGNLPMFHSFGLTVCNWLPAVTGTRTVLIPNPVDGPAALTAVREEKISVMVATPGFLQLYMRRGKPEDFKPLRLVVTGAEKLRDDVAKKFFEMTGKSLMEGYGCTELSPVVSVNMAKNRQDLGALVEQQGSIGPPLPGVCVKIVDPSTFELLPENTDGLMIVKGAIVMQGYLHLPEKTAEVIRDGWYVTGDIAKMNRNGFITITGRLSRFSKIAGEMVPHELVEREINNILQPEDRLVAVCGCSDSKKGERLLVFYTDRERLAPEELVRRLRDSGIPNLWIPKPENFIFVEKLPILGSGKLDLNALARMAEAYGD